LKTGTYLDYNATTPVAAEVIDAMQPFFGTLYGNPSSLHWAGVAARDAVETARCQVAALLQCDATEIVFTSGGTEANNLALQGVFFAARGSVKRPHLMTTQIEHPSVLEPCLFLERLGARVTMLPVDHFGRVDAADVERSLTPETILVSVMHANNEVGTIQPIAEIAEITRRHGVLFHTDAAQTVGKIPVDVETLGVDLLTVAGHKLYGPKGVGALFVREGIALEPFLRGAGHEAGRRAGTENTAAIVGLGAACHLAHQWVDYAEMSKLRDQLWDRIREEFGEHAVLNGHPTERLPNTLNVSFVGSNGAELLARMPSVAASTGSACHAGTAHISPVLQALGVPVEVALGAVRFSLGRDTTAEELDNVVSQLHQAVGESARQPLQH
jgi:cysteine desulfurase